MPYAAEAMAGLMSLGMTPPEVMMICKSNTQLSTDDNSALFDSDGLVVCVFVCMCVVCLCMCSVMCVV